MQKATVPRSSAYLTALSQEIERKLQKALNIPSHRLELLQQLFADIALEIDDRAREIILSKGEDADADEITESSLCFYDVLADHFLIKPENGQSILNLIVLLWSQSFASHIFSLLFHKWTLPLRMLTPLLLDPEECKNEVVEHFCMKAWCTLFEVPIENPEALLRYGSALVQGATNVFWIDIQSNSRRFLSLFRYLLEDVALVPTRLEKISLQARRDLFHLLSRFLFFYDFDHMLERFLKHFPIFTNTFLIGGPVDVFVIELTDQLQKLKVEPVLLHYLSSLRALQGLELRMTTSTRLKACLYSFTSPGGPMYPTRAVRHAAWGSLDLLFPVGQYPRHIISFFFRLLYPWYWPSTCWNLIKACITTILYSLLRLLFSSWERMTKSRND